MINYCMPAILVKNLSKTYGRVTAIDGLSFQIKKGQIAGFLGPNGAGKSTAMRILCGLIPATSGSAHIDGISVAKYPNLVKRQIGYMPEQNLLPEDMRVIEYLRYRALIKELPRPNIRPAVDEAMEVCDLNRKARRRIIGTLSKGFRQRVGIADAILANPQIIFMDEPTIGLDPHQIIGIRRLIDSLRGRMTLLLSSHILSEIELCCDCIIIINQGKIVAQGSSEELRQEFTADTRFRIRFRGSIVKFKEILARIEATAKIIPNSASDTQGYTEIDIDTPNRIRVAEELIIALTKENHFKISELTHHNSNLEEVFLAATRRSWDEVATPLKPKDHT